MKTKWFGDKRDYVKWSYVYQFAYREGHVLYVPMLTDSPDYFSSMYPQVSDFFSKKKELHQLSELFPSRFSIISEPYTKSEANQYFTTVIKKIRELKADGYMVVFVDPDTGIQPKGSFGPEHVRMKDLTRIWEELSINDALIVYQHAHRLTNWQDAVQQRLKAEPAFKNADLSAFCDKKIASDVCFFSLVKLAPSSSD